MKTTISATTATLLLLAVTPAAFGASCIAGQAATAGANSAYQQAKDEIDQIEQAETNASNEWTQCLGSISGQIGWPTFPSAGDIFDQIKQQVCRIAQQTVDDQISDVNRSIDEIYNQIPTSVEVPVIGGISGDAGGVSIGRGQGSLSDFYEGIWQ